MSTVIPKNILIHFMYAASNFSKTALLYLRHKNIPEKLIPYVLNRQCFTSILHLANFLFRFFVLLRMKFLRIE